VRRYTQQQRCSVPVWFEPQPLASDADQDLGDDERSLRSSNSLILGTRPPQHRHRQADCLTAGIASTSH
jgi:hypothetical protein